MLWKNQNFVEKFNVERNFLIIDSNCLSYFLRTAAFYYTYIYI